MDDEFIERAEKAWEEGLYLESVNRFLEAESAYRLAAELGHSMAQLNLANILDDWKSPANPIEAEYWYYRSWEAGESSAAWNLYIHHKRLGNYELANEWKERAAAMGHPDAK